MNRRWVVRARAILLAIAVLTVFAGCGAPPSTSSPSPTPGALSLKAAAEAEAKAIVESAEATAIVLRARETAQALIQGQGAALKTPTSAGESKTPVPGASAPTPGRGPTPPVTSATASTPVMVEKVAFGADGGFIMVHYRAPATAAQRYWQGSVSVTDEATGAKFDNVATMPVIGPLIQRPSKDGQPGYVMFHNRSAEGAVLRPGAMVTVVLNNFRQEHVLVAEN